jgi:hypothetical protein
MSARGLIAAILAAALFACGAAQAQSIVLPGLVSPIATPTSFLAGAPVNIYGTADQTRSVCFYSCATWAQEIHTINAAGLGLYSHSNTQGSKIPILYLGRSNGSQASPAAVTYTGYENNPIGGVEWAGYDGAAYVVGPTLTTFTDENWTTTRHGSHFNIYCTYVGHNLNQQCAQFGGKDAQGNDGGPNWLIFGQLNWNGNSFSNAGLTCNTDTRCHFRTGDGSAATGVTASTVQTIKVYTVSGLASAVPCNSGAEGTRAAVSDASSPTFLGALVGGGTTHAPAYCDGSNWVAG